MELLATIWELLQDVRMLHENPPRGYTVEETEARINEILKELADQANSLQQDMSVAYDGLLKVVEARLRVQLGLPDEYH